LVSSKWTETLAANGRRLVVPGNSQTSPKAEATDRVRRLNDGPVREGGDYVLYWAQANRRADSNHGLEYAAAEANRLGLPLLVYEGLTFEYPYANDRLHSFLLEAVPEMEGRLQRRGIGYVFYLRRNPSERNDALYRLSGRAAMLVTDDYPTFLPRRYNASVPPKIGVSCVAVDSSCVVPASRIPTKQYAAYALRPKIRKLLPECLRPVERVLLRQKWRAPLPAWRTQVTRDAIPGLLANSSIDHSVRPSLSYRGGAEAAERHLRHFLRKNLSRYESSRNEPSAHATSNLSPWLHFGHLSPTAVALDAQLYAAEHEFSADAFLEELIVRRELAFNHARFADPPDSLESLPDWARKTLSRHDKDRRGSVYTRDEFERAATHDDLWNACQTEMLLRGKIHGYYRMYWGKKIIEWSKSHQDALDTMLYLHDRHALDGRDPNTCTNILWCFGLHDRPWKERPIFGTVRYLSLEGMKRKTDVPAYIREIRLLRETGEDPFRLKK
jgi:deoxyribodipyrimidine photo-lyase